MAKPNRQAAIQTQDSGYGEDYYITADQELVVYTTPTKRTQVLCPTSFDATQPTFIIQSNEGSKRTILHGFNFGQASPATSAPIHILIAVDDVTRRHSSSGISLTGISPDMTLSVTPDQTVGMASAADAIASAASANVRFVDEGTYVPAVGGLVSYNGHGRPQIGTTGSILIYVVASATGVTLMAPVISILQSSDRANT